MLPSTRFLQIFCAVVAEGNYSRAAHRLGVTPAAVSKVIARHEAELGVELLTRTTRSMELTSAGARYFERCRRALELLEEAEAQLSLSRQEPRGVVRVSVPTTYGHYRVLPLVSEFRQRHPRVELEVDISNQNIDLIQDRFDLAIRMGPPPDSSLIARKLEEPSFGVFASPRYLALRGAPRSPDDLAEHDCIVFVRPSTGRPLPWFFRDPSGQPFEANPTGLLRCTGDVLGCISLARHDAGLVQAYHFLVEDDLRRGSLVEVMESYTGLTSRFSLLYPSKRGQTRAVRLFAEMLLERCGQRGGLARA